MQRGDGGTDKIRLQQRLAARKGDTAGADEVAIGQHILHKFLHRHHKRIVGTVPCIGVVTKQTAQMAPLHKRHIAYAGTVHGAKGFFGMKMSAYSHVRHMADSFPPE